MGLQAFIVYKCVTRFLTYISLPWPQVITISNTFMMMMMIIIMMILNTKLMMMILQEQQPYLELNLYVGLVGAGVVLLPFFFISFMFKVNITIIRITIFIIFLILIILIILIISWSYLGDDQIGNLSNDGYKLGYNLSTCSLDPPSVLAR